MKFKDVLFKSFMVIGDIVFINLSFILAFYLRYLGKIPSRNFGVYLDLVVHISLFSVIIIKLYNLYSSQLKKDLTDIFYSFIPVSFLVVISTVALSYFVYAFAFPRSVFLLVIPIMIPLMMLWRYGALLIEKHITRPLELVIIGNEKDALKVIKNIKKGTSGPYILKGVICNETINSPLLQEEEGVVFSDLSNYSQILENLNPDLVFITTGVPENIKKELLYLSLDKDWEVSFLPDFYEIMLSGARLEHLGELPVFEMKSFKNNELDIIKRLFDIVFALVGLILTLPLMLVVAILIKITDHGPVFYIQERVSRSGRVFKLYKFRTMVTDAEKKTGPVLATEDDNRITWIGRILRKTRLDEIPQLLNVLKGDMSLIGPRPERPFFVKQFEEELPEYKYRHKIKTGITGLAQVYGFYSTQPEDKLRMDLLYANKTSILFDFKIILQTIKVIFMKGKAS
jgi:exopolysaccharide biosynthesis polyprenyl glycosylphosphotransferase